MSFSAAQSGAPMAKTSAPGFYRVMVGDQLFADQARFDTTAMSAIDNVVPTKFSPTMRSRYPNTSGRVLDSTASMRF